MRTNITDNMPIEYKKHEAEEKAKIVAQETYQKGTQLYDDILSDGGQLVIERLEQLLIGRINLLMQRDDYCKAILDLLTGFNITVSQAQKVSDLLMLRYKKSDSLEV
jgi:hypothetical protein